MLSEAEAQNYHKIGLCQQSMVDKYNGVMFGIINYKTIFVSEC